MPERHPQTPPDTGRDARVTTQGTTQKPAPPAVRRTLRRAADRPPPGALGKGVGACTRVRLGDCWAFVEIFNFFKFFKYFVPSRSTRVPLFDCATLRNQYGAARHAEDPITGRKNRICDSSPRAAKNRLPQNRLVSVLMVVLVVLGKDAAMTTDEKKQQRANLIVELEDVRSDFSHER